MRDPARVDLSILAEHSSKLDELLKGIKETNYIKTPDNTAPTDHYTYIFDNADYGDLKFLDELQALGIAYDSYWGNGNEFGAGKDTFRFTEEGKVKKLTLYDEDRNPDLTKLMALIDTPGELVKYLKKYNKRITPLPWDNQGLYGNKYRVIQLITPAPVAETPFKSVASYTNFTSPLAKTQLYKEIE